MIDPQELIATCYRLVPHAGIPPSSEGDMRRAISTAYYAVFHTLAASNAELIAGQPQSAMTAYAWDRVYRRLDHGRAQNNLRPVLTQLSPSGVNFVRTFIDLQDLRQQADYSPHASIILSDVINIIAQAETAIASFAQLSEEERRFIAAQSLFDRR